MPSFADMKSRASKMANSGVEKVQGVRDRNTSVPMKKTNWDPYNGGPPPPPRANLNAKPQAFSPLPPPPSRTGSSIGSGSNSPATLRAPSAASAPGPPLPSRGSAGAPPLPRRTNTLEPPPLPSRRGSTSPGSTTPSPPPPPSRFSPPSRGSFQAQPSPPPPPPPNLTTKPSASPAPIPPGSFPARSPGPPPPRRTPAIIAKPPTPEPELEYHNEPEAISEKELDWANLTEEDKQVFFSWLDDFFTRLLGIPVGPASHSSAGPPSAPRLGATSIS